MHRFRGILLGRGDGSIRLWGACPCPARSYRPCALSDDLRHGALRFISEASTEHERWLLFYELAASFYCNDFVRAHNFCSITVLLVLLLITHTTYLLKSCHRGGGESRASESPLLLYGATKTKVFIRYGEEIVDPRLKVLVRAVLSKLTVYRSCQGAAIYFI